MSTRLLVSTHLMATEPHASLPRDVSLCETCPVSGLNADHAVCEASRLAIAAGYPGGMTSLPSSEHTFPARQMICHPNEWHDVVPIICRGWAASSVLLPDGRRQILAFLLPGDMISTSLLFEPTTNRFVEALTEVSCRNFKRAELRATLLGHPNLLEKFLQVGIDEKAMADQQIVDLGRRMASERIARLILNLMERLARRGMAQSPTLEFPLRHRHIADAMGLTPVHVSKVMSEFCRNGLIEISKRLLTVLDRAKLSRIAGMC